MAQVFNSYEELMQAVEDRRKDTLTLAVDMGGAYSQEYEDAKKELAQAQALKTLTGDQSFLADNLEPLKEKVEKLKPESRSVFIRFSRLGITAWASLMKQTSLNAIEQYEKVLPQTFVGVFGTDEEGAEPLSTDHQLVSTKSETAILPGGALHQVIQAFMAWQNSGGEVSFHPTKSGQGSL